MDLLTNLRKIVRFKYKINLLKKGEYSLMIRELIEKVSFIPQTWRRFASNSF